MNRRPRHARTAACVGLTLALTMFATACGGGADDGESAGTGTTVSAQQCPGEPIKFTSIVALTSPLGNAGERVRTGTDVAVDAVNRECSLGRPLEVEICDDKADPNANLACGREAGSDGSLAILGSVGSFDDGVTASELPAIFGNGTSSFELTNENDYSSVSGIALGISATSAVKARGKETSALVLPDTPTFQFAGKLIVDMAALLDVEVDQIYFPQDTTDFAPVAAQISEADNEVVGMVPLNPVVMVNALAQEGITPESHDMVVPGGVITPEVLEELGDAADGILVVSQAMPPTETSNEGIAEFRADMEAAGEDPDDPNVDFSMVTAWSNVKKLEGALLAAGPDVIASLDSQKVVDAVVNNPIDRPETAPYDFREHAIPEIEELADFRVFTRQVAVLQIEDGRYQVLSDGFIDILEPPDLADAGS